MNQSSDAAEQIVRMSLQGFEVGAIRKRIKSFFCKTGRF